MPSMGLHHLMEVRCKTGLPIRHRLHSTLQYKAQPRSRRESLTILCHTMSTCLMKMPPEPTEGFLVEMKSITLHCNRVSVVYGFVGRYAKITNRESLKNHS